MTRLPLWIITGFLGSGKTTLLRSLIRLPEFGRLAVVINEFGETGLDHDLVEASSDDTFMLEGGCLCCMVHGDLIETLSDLVTRRAVAELPPFDGVVIETSGLADPGPVIEMLLSAREIEGFYQLKSVITVVDGRNVQKLLASEEVARHQLAAADHIVLTKTDLCSAVDVTRAGVELATRAPKVPVHSIVSGSMETLRRVCGVLAQGQVRMAMTKMNRHPERLQPGRHNLEGILVHAVDLPTPAYPETVTACVSVFSALAGPKLLRGKALIVLPPPMHPVVLNAVQDMVYPLTPLARKADEDLRSRMVLIARASDRRTIEALLSERHLTSLRRQ